MVNEIIAKIKEIILKDERVIFAYLFGSFLKTEQYNDIDIGVYCDSAVMEKPFEFTSDLKIAFSEVTGISPDIFDITLINALLISDRIDSIILLGEILDGELLIDKDPECRTEIIELTSLQFRESAGLIYETFR